MSIAGPREIAATADRGKPEGKFLGLLHVVALTAVVVGAVGSLGFMLRAGRNTPRFLLVLFIIWLLSPFVLLAWANIVSKHWPVLTRATLYGVTLVLALGSLAIYGNDALRPRRAQAAFVFVLVPPVSWALMTAVPIAALISRRLSQSSAGAKPGVAADPQVRR